MCGIAGYFGLPEDKKLLETMNVAQAHRGPDGHGVFTHNSVGLAHLRLAFIDREHGQQPIYADNNNLVLIYNGEVYNFKELREELETAGRTFTTNSDSEVVLQAYAQWGTDAFDRFNGMFAVAIYDKQKEQLVLARDHFGIKPLYYINIGTDTKPQILFASEIKTLLATKKFEAKPNDRQIYRYLRFRAHEDSHETFFDGVYKLLPGEMMVVHAKGLHQSHFSNLQEEFAQAAKVKRPYNDVETEKYRKKLEESVRMRLVSEVPVGTCLSGGLDSSTIALTVNKLIQENAKNVESIGQQQNTFSAVFPGSINDEEKYIDAVLDKAEGRVASHKVYPTADTFKEDLEDFIRTQEEPTISTGPYAQYKVMEEAQHHVRALLDGQGADEMMAGYYPYYFVYLRQLKREGRYGKLLTEMLGSADVLFRFLRFRLYDTLNFRRTVGIAELLKPSFAQHYSAEKFVVVQDDLKKRFIEDIFKNSLPALLRYEDKNTMRFSLEGRVPFLDKEVMKYLFTLDNEAIIKGSWNKRILRDATKGLLPEIVRARRNKIGFTTPEVEWFKRLKTRFYGIFLSESFAERPYFNQQEVLHAFEGHIKGRNNTDTMVFWRMLNVELWLREFIDPKQEQIEEKEKTDLEPNDSKKLDIQVHGRDYRRYPLRTEMVSDKTELLPFVTARLHRFFETLKSDKAHADIANRPWHLFMSEKIVAISQGRSYFIWDIKPGISARLLSKFVVKTPHGIGLGSPWTMQLAIQEAGLPRILFAALGGIIGKVLGHKGWFYILAGGDVRAIDGPTEYSVYPSNVSAKLPPKDPDVVAEQLSERIKKDLSPELTANFRGVVVIDANDLGRNVLGHNVVMSADELEEIFADNPLGQGSERTPLCVVFDKED